MKIRKTKFSEVSADANPSSIVCKPDDSFRGNWSLVYDLIALFYVFLFHHIIFILS